MKWKPIETAPKDREILLWFTTDNGRACIGKWDENKYHHIPKPYWTCDIVLIWGVIKIRKCQPTHWCEIEPPLVGNDVPIDAIEAAVLAEREACADIADQHWCNDNGGSRGLVSAGTTIRARGRTIEKSKRQLPETPDFEPSPGRLPVPNEPRKDWRIGLSCKPRLRTHERYYEPPGTIIAVYQSGEGGITDPNGVLRIQQGNTTFLARAEDWITA